MVSEPEKKKRRGHSCKHRFVQVIEYIDDENVRLKCSWCWIKFDSIEELEIEYKRLNVPYKKVSLERYKKEDINRPEYDPTAPKEYVTKDDYTVFGHRFSQVRGNKLQYSGYRWGGKFH